MALWGSGLSSSEAHAYTLTCSLEQGRGGRERDVRQGGGGGGVSSSVAHTYTLMFSLESTYNDKEKQTDRQTDRQAIKLVNE